MSREHAQNTMGQLISAEAERDAIHIALAPVRAMVTLAPGTHVRADGTDKGGDLPLVGIVDPFLRSAVQPGQWFWLFLYPNTITGLSHVWSHPAFPATEGRTKARDLIEKVAGLCGKTYEAFVSDVRNFGYGGDYIMDNSERYKNVPDDLLLEMWPLFEGQTGVKPHRDLYDPAKKYAGTPYTCSC